MSVASVQAFLDTHAPDIQLLHRDVSLATVEEAAYGLGVAPAQIAKTMALDLGGKIILLVLGGTTRIDNRKYRDVFGVKAKLLDLADVERVTGHPVGGVCPFGLASPLRVFCDISLKEHEEVLPAAGAPSAALRIAPDRLATLVGADWIDVGRQNVEPTPVPHSEA